MQNTCEAKLERISQKTDSNEAGMTVMVAFQGIAFSERLNTKEIQHPFFLGRKMQGTHHLCGEVEGGTGPSTLGGVVLQCPSQDPRDLCQLSCFLFRKRKAI